MTAHASGPLMVSAPGKLVLFGEYAVLDGCPAVVAAVSKRARVSVDASPTLRIRGNDPRWHIVTREMLDRDGHDHHAGRDHAQPLLMAILRELHRRGLAPHAGAFGVDTASFSSSAGKLGLGSSAAAAVAFTAAALMRSDGALPSSALVHDVARTAHRAFQGGGSGIDVAASTMGGWLVFENASVQPAPPIPAGLDLIVAFTGIAAKTQGFVDAWRALADRSVHRTAIDEATRQFLVGAERQSASDVISAVDHARSAMAAMGYAARIDVVTAEHCRIADIAKRWGGASKPSGAGGGDIALCLVPSPERDRLVVDLQSAGFLVVDVRPDPDGVRIDV